LIPERFEFKLLNLHFLKALRAFNLLESRKNVKQKLKNSPADPFLKKCKHRDVRNWFTEKGANPI
jgi:hypothetical protein